MRARLILFRNWKNKRTNTLTHALPPPCDLVQRSLYGVSASHVPVASLQSHSQPKHGVSLGKKRAHSVDVGEVAVRGPAPLACFSFDCSYYMGF